MKPILPTLLSAVCLATLLSSCDRPEAETDEPETLSVNVVGEVNHPGNFQVPSKAGTLTALAQAGWFSKQGDHHKVRLIHAVPGAKPEVSTFDVEKILSGEEPDKVILENSTLLVPGQPFNF